MFKGKKIRKDIVLNIHDHGFQKTADFLETIFINILIQKPRNKFF